MGKVVKKVKKAVGLGSSDDDKAKKQAAKLKAEQAAIDQQNQQNANMEHRQDANAALLESEAEDTGGILTSADGDEANVPLSRKKKLGG